VLLEGGVVYISPISPLYLPYISPDLRSSVLLECGVVYISPISPLYLPYISPDLRSAVLLECGVVARLVHEQQQLLGRYREI